MLRYTTNSCGMLEANSRADAHSYGSSLHDVAMDVRAVMDGVIALEKICGHRVPGLKKTGEIGYGCSALHPLACIHRRSVRET